MRVIERTTQLTGLFGMRLNERVDAFVLSLFAAGLGVHELVGHGGSLQGVGG